MCGCNRPKPQVTATALDTLSELQQLRKHTNTSTAATATQFQSAMEAPSTGLSTGQIVAIVLSAVGLLLFSFSWIRDQRLTRQRSEMSRLNHVVQLTV